MKIQYQEYQEYKDYQEYQVYQEDKTKSAELPHL